MYSAAKKLSSLFPPAIESLSRHFPGSFRFEPRLFAFARDEITSQDVTFLPSISFWRKMQAAAAKKKAKHGHVRVLWPQTGEAITFPHATGRRYRKHFKNKLSIMQGVASLFKTGNDAEINETLETIVNGEFLRANPEVELAIIKDLRAIVERDPAINGGRKDLSDDEIAELAVNPFLNFKGFHALAVHRIAHAYWRASEALREAKKYNEVEIARDNAFYLQWFASDKYTVDIHPAVKIGEGFFLDHAHNVVIGETAEIGENVTMLHAVALGGTGKEAGDRHPKIGNGVTIGAGAKILGNIFVGDYAVIAAGATVTKDVPPGATMIGSPAKVTNVTPPQNDVVAVIHPIQGPRKGQAWVFTAPHYTDSGLDEIGLLGPDGALMDGISIHETKDLHLPNIVHAFAEAAGNSVTIVHGLKSRLIFEGARIKDQDLAVATTTPSGVPIPAYQGKEGRANRLKAWRGYHAYRSTLEGQIALGGKFIGSLDTFTPQSLDGDLGGPREMAISIIANDETMGIAQAIQSVLLRRLEAHVHSLQSGTKFAINSSRLVTINEPYGAQVEHRQLTFEKGKNGLIFEFRNDIIADRAKAGFLAKALWETIQEVYAPKIGTRHAPEVPFVGAAVRENTTAHM